MRQPTRQLNKYAMFERRQPRETPYMDVDGAGDYINKEGLLAEFFGIDLTEAERERRKILESL